MNQNHLSASAVKFIFNLVILVEGLGFTLTRESPAFPAGVPIPYLVKDISPGGDDSYPYFLTNVNGALFFSAKDGVHGRDLWKSDGTADR